MEKIDNKNLLLLRTVSLHINDKKELKIFIALVNFVINLQFTYLPLFNSSPQPVFLDRGGTIGLCIDIDFPDDKEIGLSRGSSSDLLSSNKLF